ncbi:TackOD1 domain-containing metal-binding protein [Jannaschia ovalis]|uniref:Response regulator n=1 Tax=Jannaschia ovalis TaxID=3038773 RepID=A0ABY8LEE3_9RHOB|nr:response regulator [Jannaschia sp. GRR-S6-38]WGH78440.1 response regulator [Jannaschia sp. GRR-S6-38]
MDGNADAITPDEASLPGPKARRVLLVEDSSVTTELVTLVLSQAGHRVSCAADGLSALEALQDEDFDVVLSDFHLPDITGIEVVRRYRENHPGGPSPAFIAITGDVRGLLNDASDCEVFDRVVPKPLDIDAVCKLVESPIPRLDLPAPAAVRATPRRDEIADLPFALLHWPLRARGALTPGLAGIDAVLVETAQDLEGLWAIPGAHLLPVLDDTGELGAAADLDLTRAGPKAVEAMHELVEAFHARRGALHPDFLLAEDPGDRLLARMHVAGGSLVPKRDGARPSLVAWNALMPDASVDAALARLEGDELVRRSFFERIHQCQACGSARLIAREECPSCGSAHLGEESYLHHFRCAHQGVEREFAQGSELICPKCRRRLAHFGQDYDRPGQLVICHACDGATSEPEVGFVCADCDARCRTDAARVRDVTAAQITDRGAGYLRSGHAGLGRQRAMFRFSDLPLDMIVALNRAASAWNEHRTPFALARIAHDRLFELQETQGARQVAEARRLWLSSLREALGEGSVCATGRNDDYALLAGKDTDAAERRLEAARARADRDIRFDLGSTVRVFGPEDLAR